MPDAFVTRARNAAHRIAAAPRIAAATRVASATPRSARRPFGPRA